MKSIHLTENDYKNDLLIILGMYSVSFFLLLTNVGIFWDDWVLHGMSPVIILDRFQQAGGPWGGYFHNTLLTIGNGISSYRIITFASFFFSAVFLYFVLYTIREISRFERLLIVLYFAILPVNSARIALINTPYAICHLLFWLGFFLLTRYLMKGKVYIRIIALISILFSFNTQSLLVYYVVALSYIVYWELSHGALRRHLIKKLLGYFDFIILPFVFWVIKSIFFSPHALYQGYNKISLKQLAITPILSLISINSSFVELFDQYLKNVSPTLAIITAGILNILIIKKYRSKLNEYSHIFLLIGALLFLLALFPYNAVGRIPSQVDWASRYQLLIPLGISFILVFGTSLIISSQKIRNFVYALLISIFIVTNISIYIDFQKDWYKQASLIENFKNSAIIRSNTTFLFNDRTEELNANKRTYRFYEFTGQMKTSFGEETRFGHLKNSYQGMDILIPYLNSYYNLRHYQIRAPQYIVYIDYGPRKIDVYEFLLLKYLEIFKRDKFREHVRDVLRLTYQRVETNE